MGWEVFSKNIQSEVGVGDRVKFWTDRWCGVSPFQLTFPVVFGIASNKEAWPLLLKDWGRTEKIGCSFHSKTK